MNIGKNSRVICGDALCVLKTLSSESVDCVVTSPPYWGLRDYGTAEWEGGDVNCDHKEGDKVQGNPEFNENRPSRENTSHQYKEICKKCGAKRIDNQLGLEKTPEEYVAKMVSVFREVKRVLKNEGTLWLNLGDSYANTKVGNTETIKNPNVVTNSFKKELPPGLKPKDLVGIPWRVAFALQADGWYLRQDIIWAKPNPMPESVTDRCTKSHEYIFLLAKSQKYYFDAESIKERATSNFGKGVVDTPQKYSDGIGNQAHSGWMGGDGEYRNKRSVWTVTTKPFSEAHFATFPEKLITPMILAGCPESGTVLDCFSGAGTTGVVCAKLGRKFIGIELSPEYVKIAEKRIKQETDQRRLF